MPVVVAVVLEGVVGGVGFGGVVGATHVSGGLAGERGVSGEDGGALRQVQIDVAFEVDGEADVGSGGEVDGTAAGCCCRLNGFVDGGGVDGLAVAGCPVGADIEE